MRRALLLVLAGCRTVATDARTAAVPDAAAKPVAAVADAAAVEAPLAWATRPPREGPLYPVVDGPCSRGEVWPVGRSALFTFGGPMGRFDDDGLVVGGEVTAASDPKHPFSEPDVKTVIGTWPAPLVIHGDEHGMGRMRSYDSTWYREANGWALLGSYREKGEPSYTRPILHRGWIVTARSAPVGPGSDEAFSADIIVAYPAEKGATPVPGIMQLGRANLHLYDFAASDTTLYAFGWSRGAGASTHVIRFLKDGKVGEVAGTGKAIGTTSTALYTLDEDRISRLEDGKLTKLPYKPPAGAKIIAASVAPNGDVWLRTRNSVVVLHGDMPTETLLPAPSKPVSQEKVVYTPISGSALAGVELGDPYAIDDAGTVFHLAGGSWTEVPLPAPPFAASGKYRAQALRLPAKGDLYVNAGYVEKGVGWTATTGYRAILRTKRPKEVLRCSDPQDEIRGVSSGVMSFPPLADESCKTPFVILLRIGFGDQRTFGPDADYPSVRAAIKETPSLGTTVDLVELVSGSQRFLGARVPSLAAGQDLARAAVKKVKVEFFTTKPEVVCGTPKEERVVHVDVATGNVK